MKLKRRRGAAGGVRGKSSKENLAIDKYFIQMLVDDYCHPVECRQQDCRGNDRHLIPISLRAIVIYRLSETSLQELS